MRLIKTLPIIAFAALALAALPAVASASTPGFVANGDPLYGTLTGTPSGQITLGFAGGTINCSTPTLHSEIAEAEESFTAALPAEISCFTSTLKANGCKLKFHPETLSSETSYKGTFEIGPEGCGPMTVSNFYGCTLTLYPTAGLSATYTNSGSGSEAYVRVSTGATKIKGYYPKPCGSGEIGYNGLLNAEWTVKAERVGGPVSFAAATALPDGLGFGLGEEGSKFAAIHYPAAVVGAGSAEWKVLGGTQHMSCGSSSLSKTLSEPVSPLVLSAAYSGCNFLESSKSKVVMNGCNVVLTSISPGAGTYGVSCPAGAAIELQAYATKLAEEEHKWLCMAAIGTQENLNGVSFPGGLTGTIPASISVSGIKYTLSKKSILCPAGWEGTKEDGTFTQSTTLSATR